MIRRLLREPLLHFLLIGLVLFAVYAWRHPSGGGDHEILVSEAQVRDLAAQFQATWHRAPDARELSSLVDNWVQDEILFREGVSLGLDRNDPVIKRRVRQKLEIMSEELGGAAPTDADLAAYLAAHPERFRQPARISFEQIYFSPDAPEPELARRVEAARVALKRGTDPARLGQPSLLPRSQVDQPLDLVARDFGREYASQLENLPVGDWQGPVASGLGLHLVRISARTPGRMPPLDQVRQAVEREWESERRSRAFEESYRRLREQYDVKIAMPAAAS